MDNTNYYYLYEINSKALGQKFNISKLFTKFLPFPLELYVFYTQPNIAVLHIVYKRTWLLFLCSSAYISEFLFLLRRLFLVATKRKGMAQRNLEKSQMEGCRRQNRYSLRILIFLLCLIYQKMDNGNFLLV